MAAEMLEPLAGFFDSLKPEDIKSLRSLQDDLVLLPPEELANLSDTLDIVQENPEMYDQLRADLIRSGEITPQDLPEEYNSQFLKLMDALIKSGMQRQEQERGPQEAMPQRQEFSYGGIASLGRHGDTMLAHITPGEAHLLKSRGGSGTINPFTGQPEFFLKKLFKSVGSFFKKAAPILLPIAAIAAPFLLPAMGAWGAATVGFLGKAGTSALVSGLGTLLMGGKPKDALKAAAITGLGSAVAGGVASKMGGETFGSGFGSALKPGGMEGARAALAERSLGAKAVGSVIPDSDPLKNVAINQQLATNVPAQPPVTRPTAAAAIDDFVSNSAGPVLTGPQSLPGSLPTGTPPPQTGGIMSKITNAFNPTTGLRGEQVYKLENAHLSPLYAELTKDPRVSDLAARQAVVAQNPSAIKRWAPLALGAMGVASLFQSEEEGDSGGEAKSLYDEDRARVDAMRKADPYAFSIFNERGPSPYQPPPFMTRYPHPYAQGGAVRQEHAMSGKKERPYIPSDDPRAAFFAEKWPNHPMGGPPGLLRKEGWLPPGLARKYGIEGLARSPRGAPGGVPAPAGGIAGLPPVSSPVTPPAPSAPLAPPPTSGEQYVQGEANPMAPLDPASSSGHVPMTPEMAKQMYDMTYTGPWSYQSQENYYPSTHQGAKGQYEDSLWRMRTYYDAARRAMNPGGAWDIQIPEQPTGGISTLPMATGGAVPRLGFAWGGTAVPGDWTATGYLNNNPDVRSAFHNMTPAEREYLNSKYGVKTLNDFAVAHWNYAGNAENRTYTSPAPAPSGGSSSGTRTTSSTFGSYNPASGFTPSPGSPGTRPVYEGGPNLLPPPPPYVPPSYNVSRQPYVSAGQMFGAMDPNVAAAYAAEQEKARNKFLELSSTYDLIDPENPQTFRSGGPVQRMDLPHNNHQLPQTPYGPRVQGPVLGPGHDTSDNIAAALSPNEFVFTADAVRGAGNGNIDRGIQQMYRMMHQFERRA